MYPKDLFTIRTMNSLGRLFVLSWEHKTENVSVIIRLAEIQMPLSLHDTITEEIKKDYLYKQLLIA